MRSAWHGCTCCTSRHTCVLPLLDALVAPLMTLLPLRVQDERDRSQAERLAWLDLLHQPGRVLAAYAPVVRAYVPARVVCAVAAAPQLAEADETTDVWQ